MKLSASLSVSTTTGPERTPYWRIARKPPSGRRWAKKWVTESVIRKFSSERTRGGWLLASDRAHTSSGTTRKENSRIEKISEISTKNVKEHNVDRYSEEQASGHHSRVQILSFCFPFAFSHSHRGSCGELVLGAGRAGQSQAVNRQSSIVDRRQSAYVCAELMKILAPLHQWKETIRRQIVIPKLAPCAFRVRKLCVFNSTFLFDNKQCVLQQVPKIGNLVRVSLLVKCLNCKC